MKRHRRKRFYLFLGSISVSVVAVGIILGVYILTPLFRAGAASNKVMDPSIGLVTPMRPNWKMMQTMSVQDAQAGMAVQCAQAAALPKCYTPQQFATANGFTPLFNQGINGKGRIITIVDAFQSPTIRQDLATFDQLFNLPPAQLNILAPQGLRPFNPNDPNQTGFAGEISLDVEWAHAMAPGATIDLVLANPQVETQQGQLTALLNATNFAVQNSIGSVISQSFGTSEQCMGPALLTAFHKVFAQAVANKQTVFASAGDRGAAVAQCDQNGQVVNLARGVNYPASDPLVTSVGGTTLLADANGQFMSEKAWNEVNNGGGATGGGASMFFPLPTFQNNVVNSKVRAASDIAFDADAMTGVPVVSSSIMPGKTVLIPVGGTSVGSPVAAAMIADADQMAGNKRMGFLNPALYQIGQTAALNAQAYHDITQGNNNFAFQVQQANGNIVTTTVPGFNTAAGWDPPTGWGTPNAAVLDQALQQFMT